MSGIQKCHIDQIDAYSHRVDRIEVLVKQLQAEVFGGEPDYPASLQAVTNFLEQEIEDTKAEANRLVDIEIGRSVGDSV